MTETRGYLVLSGAEEGRYRTIMASSAKQAARAAASVMLSVHDLEVGGQLHVVPVRSADELRTYGVRYRNPTPPDAREPGTAAWAEHDTGGIEAWRIKPQPDA